MASWRNPFNPQRASAAPPIGRDAATQGALQAQPATSAAVQLPTRQRTLRETEDAPPAYHVAAGAPPDRLLSPQPPRVAPPRQPHAAPSTVSDIATALSGVPPEPHPEGPARLAMFERREGDPAFDATDADAIVDLSSFATSGLPGAAGALAPSAVDESALIARTTTPRELRWVQQLLRLNRPYQLILRQQVTERARDMGVQNPLFYLADGPEASTNERGKDLKKGTGTLPSANYLRYKILGTSRHERNVFATMWIDGERPPKNKW